MTTLQIDSADPTPPFEQIRRQLATLIETGALVADQRLPTIRQLAADLRVAPGTVSRAFKELEAAGYVETHRAAGTRVLPQARPNPAARLMRLADDYALAGLREGADAAEIIDAVKGALARREGSTSG